MIRQLCHVALPAVLLLAVAGAARGAQVRITGILGPDSTAVETTDDVELIPWGSFSGGGIRVGQPLSTGDELRAVSGRTIVELACADTAIFTLTDRFRVAIRDQAQSCRVDIGSGEVHVVGSANTSAEVGGVTMGAVRTVYITHLAAHGAAPRRLLGAAAIITALMGLAALGLARFGVWVDVVYVIAAVWPLTGLLARRSGKAMRPAAPEPRELQPAGGAE